MKFFLLTVSGIVTARDKFVIGFDKNEIRNRIIQFRIYPYRMKCIKDAI